ncbi:MAG: response regulator [Phycisphaerae bacterium]|nr:response regulator [Phycisphaerae bacterium]
MTCDSAMRAAEKLLSLRTLDLAVTLMRSARGVDWIVIAACITIATLLAVSVHATERSRMIEALDTYRADQMSASAWVAHHVEGVFCDLYRDLRTIARLPGVRTISRYATKFDANAHRAVQEICNKVAQSVPVSTVCIIPADLDPDAIDPLTGKLQAPIATFNQRAFGTLDEENPIHAYRVMHAQIAQLRAACPHESNVSGLAYPAVCTPQTGHTGASALVYSVPFYAPDGELRGCISAVLCTSGLAEIITDPDRALVCVASGVAVISDRPGAVGGMARGRAEDGPDNRRLLSFYLRNAGAHVEIAANGRVALEMIVDAAQRAMPYDLLLSDMQMPEMDGYTLARTLRARGWTTPIIAFGCDDYLTKPVDRQALLATCDRCRAKSHRAAAA